MVLFLWEEKANGDKSKYEGLIESLATNFKEFPLLFGPDELKYLKGCNLINTAIQEQAN